MRIGPSLQSPASTRPPHKPIGLSDTRHRPRPTHKRTTSAHSVLAPGYTTPYEEKQKVERGKRSLSPNAEDDMSESEVLIWTIIRQRVSQTDFVVEEREEYEEDDSPSIKISPKDLQTNINFYRKQREISNQSLKQQWKYVKNRVMGMMDGSGDEEKLSQRETPQLSERVRESVESDGTVRGPGGSVVVKEGKVGEVGNRQGVVQALRLICLPGDLFRKHRESVESTISTHSSPLLVILLSSSFPSFTHYSGIYELQPPHIVKITPSAPGPNLLPVSAISSYLAFDAETQGFVEVKDIQTCHAVRLSPAYCYY